MSNLNPPRLSNQFSKQPVAIPFDGATSIDWKYTPFAGVVVHNGRILGFADCDLSSGTQLVFGPDVKLAVADSLEFMSSQTFQTVLTQDALPIGTVLAYVANNAPPAGYMWLRKLKLNKVTYAALYSIIGDTFNDGSQQASEFMLPDAEGYFLRPWDSTGLIDPARTFGSKQADDLKSHTHLVSAQGAGASGGAVTTLGGTGTAITTATGGTETRPKNIAINYIIKVTDGYKNPQLIDLANLTNDVAVLKAKALPGIGGHIRNGRCLIPTAAATLVYTADQLLVEDSNGGAFKIRNLNASLNLASVGVGGMDVGTAPVNGYVAIYAIMNPTNNAVGLLAVNATSAVAGNVYGGANLPAGYGPSCLLTVLPTNASGAFKICRVVDRQVYLPLTLAYTGAVIASFTPVSLASTLPPNAIEASGELVASSSTASSLTFSVAADATTIGQQAIALTTNGNGAVTTNFGRIPLNTPQTLSFQSSSSAGTAGFSFYISGYSV